jgi:hypothetical protein
MNKFRPQEISKSYVMKQRLKYGRTDNFNWQTRSNWVPASFTKNQVSIFRRWQQIHHFASHAPSCLPHWKVANKMFNEKFFASKGNPSMRFANTYTAHSWL